MINRHVYILYIDICILIIRLPNMIIKQVVLFTVSLNKVGILLSDIQFCATSFTRCFISLAGEQIMPWSAPLRKRSMRYYIWLYSQGMSVLCVQKNCAACLWRCLFDVLSLVSLLLCFALGRIIAVHLKLWMQVLNTSVLPALLKTTPWMKLICIPCRFSRSFVRSGKSANKKS